MGKRLLQHFRHFLLFWSDILYLQKKILFCFLENIVLRKPNLENNLLTFRLAALTIITDYVLHCQLLLMP